MEGNEKEKKQVCGNCGFRLEKKALNMEKQNKHKEEEGGEIRGERHGSRWNVSLSHRQGSRGCTVLL